MVWVSNVAGVFFNSQIQPFTVLLNLCGGLPGLGCGFWGGILQDMCMVCIYDQKLN